jgi:hypothetical protein
VHQHVALLHLHDRHVAPGPEDQERAAEAEVEERQRDAEQEDLREQPVAIDQQLEPLRPGDDQAGDDDRERGVTPDDGVARGLDAVLADVRQQADEPERDERQRGDRRRHAHHARPARGHRERRQPDQQQHFADENRRVPGVGEPAPDQRVAGQADREEQQPALGQPLAGHLQCVSL